MEKLKSFKAASIIAMVLATALLFACQASSPSELTYEALCLGNNLFVITKTTEETKANLHLPLIGIFAGPQDLQAGDVVAFNIDELMESFPPQAKISRSEKLAAENRSYAAGFLLAQQLLEIRPESTFLIDVRTAEEFAEGHVPESINIPVGLIDEIRNCVPARDSTIFIYCRSGNRTVAAAKALWNLGYKVIFDLGGISGYSGDLEKG
ncbi:MAG: rhodanese-like domain-containing protein [Bacillota bacterium]|nr:rhodanese-like domain-containing protein [Bacillota bacterium]